ncbi:MBL fold metallo-hydrolase [Methanofollis fontis]|uniref:MBL fold hydrolase n=1 Tax=Methanofollis fontis TaxID=2052832 RepID=A0A483CRZ1_9EURY|nr:MBL fold metallo-hydrolase [Methanofollis fontis]TAJ44031.1 MBL fold hydrolase [Methanofollis fontis]
MVAQDEKFSFIARMPDSPGSLQRAAAIIKRYGGNINRIQYSRCIDPSTVFFEVTASFPDYLSIQDELAAIGYLQRRLPAISFLRFNVQLPHHPGALADFLEMTTDAGANIAHVDFDDSGKHPDRLTVSLSLEESENVDALLNALKSRYPLEILDYDTTGERLDDTVFYVCFAQRLRTLIGSAEDPFLLHLLQEINHIVQELTNRGEDPLQVFASITETGETLKRTSGEEFYADVQRIDVGAGMTLICFQLPGGGNIYVFETADEAMMVDTGYGIYYPDVIEMFRHYGVADGTKLRRVVITHADADHCGAGGFYQAPAFLHRGTEAIIQSQNRATGSPVESSILESVYTTIINLFSRFTPPEDYTLFPEPDGEMRGIFPVLDRFTFAGMEFEVLESLGGHLHGLVYLFCPEAGILLTSDTVINFGSLTEARRRYSSLADFLVTSVNVNSDVARTERRALLEIAADVDRALAPSSRRCLVCGGHGAVSVLENGRLSAYGEIEHYTRGKKEGGPIS